MENIVWDCRFQMEQISNVQKEAQYLRVICARLILCLHILHTICVKKYEQQHGMRECATEWN